MSYRLAWTVFCRTAPIDRDSNNISLIEVIEQLAAVTTEKSGEGVLAIQAMLVSLWYRADDNVPAVGNARVRLEHPDGKQRGEPVNFEVNLRDHKRVRTRLSFGGLTFSGVAGQHFFVVECDDAGKWVEVARVPIEIGLETPAKFTTTDS